MKPDLVVVRQKRFPGVPEENPPPDLSRSRLLEGHRFRESGRQGPRLSGGFALVVSKPGKTRRTTGRKRTFFPDASFRVRSRKKEGETCFSTACEAK